MSTKQTEALKLALEGLEKWHFDKDPRGADEYITAIREALAEQPAQQQEPVAIGRVRFDDGEVNIIPFGRDAEESGLIDGQLVYTSPPNVPTARASKPLTDEEIKRRKPISADFVSFRAGVRCMEREYGIGAKR